MAKGRRTQMACVAVFGHLCNGPLQKIINYFILDSSPSSVFGIWRQKLFNCILNCLNFSLFSSYWYDLLWVFFCINLVCCSIFLKNRCFLNQFHKVCIFFLSFRIPSTIMLNILILPSISLAVLFLPYLCLFVHYSR